MSEWLTSLCGSTRTSSAWASPTMHESAQMPGPARTAASMSACDTKAKARRNIRGSGQGIGQITDAPPVAELVDRLEAEFTEARASFVRKASA